MTQFFNAFHAPLGAHSSFTLGCKGKSGGLGLEMGTPACENVYIGLMNRDDNDYSLLPFYQDDDDESLRYDQDLKKDFTTARSTIHPFKDEDIRRAFQTGTDSWKAGDLECTILSSPFSAPDPSISTVDMQKFAYCPAVNVNFTIDNRTCHKERTALFGYDPSNTTDSPNIIRNLPEGYSGIASGRSTAIITNGAGAVSAQDFSAENIINEPYRENYNFGLGCTTLLLFKVPAGEKISFHIAICFYRGGIVTSGEDTSYWYSRYFSNINEVGVYALENFDKYENVSQDANREFQADHLNSSQHFQLAHSIRSYFGSTQFLDWNNEPFWVVNEGEYRMMNTFDLTVDQLFFEMRQNSWTVKNELDYFVKKFCYTDKLHFPGEENLHQGGISFTHDMGVRNNISRPEYSAYERFGRDDCFSHMTHEQLVNWILCAAVYVTKSDDQSWFNNNRNIFEQCLDSLVNRDHPEDDKRNGLMALDSSRTLNGSEITTYDSLDQSLGQSRNNVYIAVKCWSSYLVLSDLLDGEYSQLAERQAMRTSESICSHLNKEGFIPAIMGENCDSKIIPAIEGLVFPYYLGMKDILNQDGPFGKLIKTLKIHFTTVLKKGICLYEDNGWKLSSSADNSWLSKIYISQFIARHILEIKTPETGILADQAHHNWLLKKENLFFAWSDQMKSGVAIGSKYYPRGVTSVLWLDEGR
jgi:hypothetical protein